VPSPLWLKPAFYRLIAPIFLTLALAPVSYAIGQATPATSAPPVAPTPPPRFTPTPEQIAQQAASEADHQQMMDQLHIRSIREGANGNDSKAPNAANYDESKANPYPDLPDPLTLKDGKKVISAKLWWSKRCPEIVEDFDHEIYGRAPVHTPKVMWEVVSTTNEKNGDVAIISKKLVGHVDNSSYPAVSVNIDLTLSTPANAKGPVPVIV